MDNPYEQASIGELEAELQRLHAEMKAVKAKKRAIAQMLDRHGVVAEAEQILAKASPAARRLLTEGIASGEAHGELGG